MADLDPDDPTTRRPWWTYARELARRGLWPKGEITVHGPHAPPANRVWGAAEVTMQTGGGCDVHFATERGDGLDTLEVWMDDCGDRHIFHTLDNCELSEQLRNALSQDAAVERGWPLADGESR